MATHERCALVDFDHESIPVKRQCELLCVSRSSVYYKSTDKTQQEQAFQQKLLNAIDQIFTAYPFYGARRISRELRREPYGIHAGRKRVAKAMETLGLQAIYPGRKKGKNTSKSHKNHEKFPYLLSDVVASHPNHIWGTDITYIRLEKGWAYLSAIIDWYSRYVIAFTISAHPDVALCHMTLETALATGYRPDIHNSDQGSTYTAQEYITLLANHGITISMDGRGRCMDNIFTERLWRTVKYENVFLMSYKTVEDAKAGLTRYFQFYNDHRLHQALDYKTPSEVYFNCSLSTKPITMF